MMMPNMALNLAQANQFSPLRLGMGLPAMAHFAGMGMNEHVLSMMQNGSGGGVSHGAINNQGAQPSLPNLVQLQKDNEALRRRIMEMEQAQGGTQASASVEEVATTAASTDTNDVLQQELNRMQRDFMIQNGMNNQYVQFDGANNDMHLNAMHSQMGYTQQAAAQEGVQAQEQQKEIQEQQQPVQQLTV